MSWRMKYIITLDSQLIVTGFGLVFNQHCTDRSKLSKEPYLVQIFNKQLADLGEKSLDGLNSHVLGQRPSEAPSFASASSAVQDVIAPSEAPSCARSVIAPSQAKSSTALSDGWSELELGGDDTL